MSAENESFHPRAEYRKKIASTLNPTGSRVDIGFLDFSYEKHLKMNGGNITQYELYNLDKNNKDDTKFAIVGMLWRYMSGIQLGTIPTTTTGDFDFMKDPKSKERKDFFEKNFGEFDKFISKISGLGNIQSFRIESGKAIVDIKNPVPRNPTRYIFNLSEIFSVGTSKELLFQQTIFEKSKNNPTHSELDKLRTSIDKESFFGGSLIVEYAEKAVGTAIMATAIRGSISTALYNSNRTINKIFFKGENGIIQELTREQIDKLGNYVGSKSALARNIFRILAKTGHVYNVTRNTFTTPARAAFDKATQAIRLLKPGQLKMQGGESFEVAKTDFLSKITRVTTAGIGDFFKKLPATGMHAALFGVFFREYQKNSTDIVSLYKGIAEIGLFTAGARAGGAVTPGLWKIPGSLVGGGLAIVGGGLAGGAMNLDKTMWKMIPDREASDGKSFIIHSLTLGTVNDAMDKSDTDFRIGGLRGGARIYNPFGKDLIFPDISFNRTTVDFGTNPRQYLTAGVREMDLWNKRLDEFMTWSTAETLKVLDDYRSNKRFFSPGNIAEFGLGDPLVNKRQALASRLAPILGGIETSFVEMNNGGKTEYILHTENKRFQSILDDLIYVITTQIAPLPQEEQRIRLEMIIGNYANVVKIDSHSIQNDKELLSRDKAEIDDILNVFVQKKTIKDGTYIKDIWNRMQNAKPLVNGTYEQYYSPAEKGMNVRWVPDVFENKIYQGLLSDSSPADSIYYDIVGYNPLSSKEKPPTNSDVFVALLNIMTEYKRQKFYIDEISKTGYGIKWTL